MARRHYAVHASATFFGRAVGEVTARAGQALQVGGNDELAVPLPKGQPYLARITWRKSDTAAVVDGSGQQYLLSPSSDVQVASGPVAVHLRMVPTFSLKRTEPLNWYASLTWLITVIAVSLLTSQIGILVKHRCDWFGICPPVVAASGGTGVPGGSEFTAQYLERLLKKDYAGEDVGYVAPPRKFERHEKTSDFFMPAGNDGPITDMGGAEQKSLRPVRTVSKEEEKKKVAKRPEKALVAPEGIGTPVDMPKDQEDVASQNQEDEPEVAEVDEDLAAPPAEEKEGWGVQDWYDAEDQRRDDRKIDLMLEYSKLRLRIDPNDPEALQVLSYYQYLSEDFDGALETYDKFIALYPEESAGYNNKALVYKRQAQYEEEESLYRVALTYSPNDFTTLNNLAVNLSHQGRHDEALAIVKGLQERKPKDAYTLLHRSKICAATGDEACALEYLDKALHEMEALDTLHHIEFRQDIRVDPVFSKLRKTERFRAILWRYYGKDSPLQSAGDL